MNRKFSLTIEFSAEAETSQQALELIKAQLAQYQPTEGALSFEGYVHPDGRVLPCPLPPEGFRLELIHECDNYHCRWDFDHVVALAIPLGQEMPADFNLVYPEYDEGNRRDWKDLLRLPASSLIWRDQGDRAAWHPVLEALELVEREDLEDENETDEDDEE